MKLLLDQGIPWQSAAQLRERGFDTWHVSERSMAKASDEEIITLARLEQRVVVTLDADFHAFLALQGAVTPSVIRIRFEGLNADTCTPFLVSVLDLCQTDLEQGSAISISEDKTIRVRKLPFLK